MADRHGGRTSGLMSPGTRTAGAATLVALVAAVALHAAGAAAQPPPVAMRGADWPQWGGPDRSFIVDVEGLAATWPADGPPVLWDRPLGPGHSAIVVDDGRLFTMYRAGDGRAKQGPWDAEESVIALDAATGETLWRHTYPSRREDFSFGAGPHATPIVVGERLFTFGTNKQLRAFDKRTGRVLWARDLIDEGSPELLIRPVVKTGHGCSLIAWRDTIICQVGGPGQSVMAFRQSDGATVWQSGHFLTSEAPPILIALGGRTHLVVLGGGAVHGLDPETGEVLWSHPHDPGNDLNCGMPLWSPEERTLFLSSAYRAGSRALRLTPEGGTTRVEELWFTNRVRFMFLNALRLGGHVYGTTGDFGPAFLTALDLATGRAAWQHRGFGRASLIHAGDRTIILDEDGDLALARLSPEGAEILAEAKVFDTTSWTVPTLVGTTLFARDRERIVALDLGDPAAPRDGLRNLLLRIPPPPPAPEPPGKWGQSPFPVPAEKRGLSPFSVSAISGTWRLVPEASRTQDVAALAGMPGGRAADTLHISHAANGAVTVEHHGNGGHLRFYRLGAESTTPAGQSGTIVMDARREERGFAAEGRLTVDAGAEASVTGVRERVSVSPDGARLTVEVALTIDGTTRTGTLVYTRLSSVGPCESWASPCKRVP